MSDYVCVCVCVFFFSGVKKKIVAASDRKDRKDLLPWLKSITNHLYWSCASSKGDQEVRMTPFTNPQLVEKNAQVFFSRFVKLTFSIQDSILIVN